MPGICCAVGCDNSRQRNPGIQFVSIPKDLDRRNKWLAAIRRDHWQPTSNSRLCSQHFVSGKLFTYCYLFVRNTFSKYFNIDNSVVE